MKISHVKSFVTLSAGLLVVGVMTLGLAAPANARSTDNVNWAECNNRQTLKTKVLKNGAGQKPGTLYVYKCSNGIYARVKPNKKASVFVGIQRTSNPRSSYLTKQDYAFQAMTNMVYVKGGACYYAKGSMSLTGAFADINFCL